MDDLIAFLHARLDEDEQIALPVSSGGNWNITINGDPGWGIEGDRRMVEHIARHDPARVLADVAAKRAIIEEYRKAQEAGESVLWTGGEYARILAFERVIEILALTYADHPDHRTEWRA